MPTAVRELVLSAIATKLGELSGYSLERNPPREAAFASLPSLALLDGGHPVPKVLTGQSIYDLNVTVELYVGGNDLGASLSQAYADVVSKLNEDRTLGNLAHDCVESGMSEPEILNQEGSPLALVAQLDFTVTYTTAENDPFTVGPQ